MNKILFLILLLYLDFAAVEGKKANQTTKPPKHPPNRKTKTTAHAKTATAAVVQSTRSSTPKSPIVRESQTSKSSSSQKPATTSKPSSPGRMAAFHKNKNYGEVKNILKTLRERAAASVPAKARMRMDTPAEVPKDHAEHQDDTEIAKNQKIKEDLFEGDVVLTLDQAKGLLDGADTNLGHPGTGQKTKRKVVKDADERWPGNVVYYTYEEGLDTYKIHVIEAAMKIWEGNTCIRFQPGTGQGDFITFVDGSGCYSSVGKTGGQQEISIGDGCETTGIACHEIGHTLGFWHEQSRFDRNDYIKLVTHNIYELEYGNFARASRRVMDDFGVPYDLGSVMHYGPKAFSVNDGITIRTLDKNYQRTIGQREKLSFADIKQVNTAYCGSICAGGGVPCQHGGYPDPTGGGSRCQVCKCPTGFSGAYCDVVEPSPTSGCGGTLTATNEWQSLSTPNGSPNQHCNWLVKATAGNRITLEIVNVDMRCRDTCYSYLEVKTGPNFVSTGARFCCQNSWVNPILSDRSEMVLIYHTDGSTKNSGSGAQVRYRSELADTESDSERSSDTVASGAPWGEWSAWSLCTATCGGCGLKFRTRTCSVIPNRNNCSGESSQRISCGDALCLSDTGDGIDAICRFRTQVPCSYFYSDPSTPRARDSRPRFDTPVDFDGKVEQVDLRPERRHHHHHHHHHNHYREGMGQFGSPTGPGRRKRSEAGIRQKRQGEYNCAAYGYYPCSKNSPYFYREMDSNEIEIRKGGSPNDDVHQCCNGFEPQGDTCKRRSQGAGG